MSDYSYVKIGVYFDPPSGGTFVSENATPGTITDADDDDQFETGDNSPAGGYIGQVTINGVTAPAFDTRSGTYLVYFPTDPGALAGTVLGAVDNSPFVFCFARGTMIATPGGQTAVEALSIGDRILTCDGQVSAVKWVGRHTVLTAFSGDRMRPVRIRAGALGDGLPRTDLTVTADHGIVLDGVVINASALVNHTTIDFVPQAELPQQMTFYHVETEGHEVILANGAPAETFIDVAGRRAFDNYQEYLDLYGVERVIPARREPRVSAARHLPAQVRRRLGLSGDRATARSA